MTDTTQVGRRPTEYAPRKVSAHGWEEVRGWTVKRYGISALRDEPGPEVMDFARHAVLESLPEADPSTLCYAYSIVHEDADGCYVVVGWWSPNRLIAHTRTWLADWRDLDDITEAGGHATACVWELAVMAYERETWLHHVVKPAQPDTTAYTQLMVTGDF